MAKRRPANRSTSSNASNARTGSRETAPAGNPSRSASSALGSGFNVPGGPVPPTTPIVPGLQTTGRMIVTLRDGAKPAMKSMMRKLQDHVGVKAAMASDYGSSIPPMSEALADGALLLEEIGVVIIAGDSDQMSAMATTLGGSDEMIIEPEYINYAMGLDMPYAQELPGATAGSQLNVDYLRGYRAACDAMIEMLSPASIRTAESAVSTSAGAGQATWGLTATGVTNSRFSGAGVRVAVLDTGFDLNHPDFVGRNIQTASFIDNQSVQDGNGHGTHCIGTACGPRTAASVMRYGIAYQADIYAGKVLSNQGSGGDGSIMAGINWAVTQGCRIISMSLGRPTFVGEPPSQSYEMTASRALRAGTLIIAAAGNDSQRPGLIRPVSSPANSPSIVSVAAVNSRFEIASFSNRALNGNGGEVNFAGPGVDVFSTWPLPRQYNTISGTSMATPHVAGIAALYLQADPGLDAIGLYRAIAGRCRRLNLPTTDIGWGLIQAP